MEPGLQLEDSEGKLIPGPSQFRRLLGRLMYLSISRPDIIFAINKLSQFMSNPRTPHLQALHQIPQYLKSSPEQGLLFPHTSNTAISAYVDSDWETVKLQGNSQQVFVCTWVSL